ncbi:MAG: hypothetical protein U9Q73_03010 [Nanoarchaeota archaeon]|nr:hypothetical protein [Nanoarchaeota archaeon]
MKHVNRVLILIILSMLLLTAVVVNYRLTKFHKGLLDRDKDINNELTQETSQLDIIPSARYFKDTDNWEAFDASKIGGLQTKGYYGATYDGRYIYYAPCRTQDFHGIVLRYDTQGDFKSKNSWESYDASSIDGLTTVGYAGAIFDGRYVYYTPFTESTKRHAKVLRFDTKGEFTSSSSWSAFDAESVGSGIGYDGEIFDGKYVYFAPFGYDPFAHSRILRLDTEGDFKQSSSWDVYDAKKTDGLDTKGFYGMAFDGRYTYFVPFNDGNKFHGRVLRYDTRNNFEDAESWSAYDAGNTGGKDTKGYKGAVFDGRYVYFVPFRSSKQKQHALVLRYDTQGDFKSSSSWSVYDAESTDGLDTRGYVGAEFDGKYIYFVPYSGVNNIFHAKFLRYDTEEDFMSSSSWSAYDARNIDGLNTQGYKYSTSDGEYIYFVPYNNGQTFSGIALRYKF